ncbi:MAG: hypothetical protein GY811_08410 [Myxococcales bacterium]|nr:hypothetical protein [Myxococcales bacterium]
MEGAALGIAAAEEPEAPEEVEEKAEAAETEEAAEGPGELTEQEEQEVAELKARDAEVRAHEQAHVAAAGGHTSGGIKYEFQRGPDNQQYAVGGHVSIDTAPVQGDPARTIQKAETVRRAALAPAEPSAADKQVAAKASRTATQARIELATEQQEELAEAKEEADAERDEHADQEGARPTVHASHALASYAMAA